MKTLMMAFCVFVVVSASLSAEIPDTTWNALLHRQVVIEMADGNRVYGELIGVASDSVTAMGDDGEVVTVKKADAIAVRGAARTAPKETEDAPPAVKDAPLGSMYFSFNPLGLLQFGPSFDFGFQAADGFYVVPQIRLAGLGVLYYFISEAYPSVESILGVAASVRLSYLFKNPGKPNCWYVDGLFGYQFDWLHYDQEASDGGDFNHNEIFIAGAGFGHRWRPPSKPFFDLGLIGGAAIQTVNFGWPAGDPTDIDDNKLLNYFIFMIEISFGWEWGNRPGKGG